jgi:hypothetical protein
MQSTGEGQGHHFPHVGREYDVDEGNATEQTSGVVRAEESSAGPRERSPIYSSHGGDTTVDVGVREGPFGNVQAHGIGGNGDFIIGNGTSGIRGGHTTKPSDAFDQAHATNLGKHAEGRPEVSHLFGVEDSLSLVRRSEPVLDTVHLQKSPRNHHRLVDHPEGKERESLSAIQVGSDSRGSHDGNIRPTATATSVPQNDGSLHGKAGQTLEIRDARIFSALDQAGSNIHDLPEGDGKWFEHRRGQTGISGETLNAGGTEWDYDPLWWEPSRYRAVLGNGRHHQAPLGRRIGKNFSSTRLPATEDEKATPLHSKEVNVAKLKELTIRMTDSSKARFEYVWNLIFYPDVRRIKKGGRSSRSTLQKKHGDLLVQHGVAIQTNEEIIVESSAFTVLEERETGLRQRFILWTKGLNQWMKEAEYHARVPLHHISHYLQDIGREFTATRDITCGFYTIEIPASQQYLFRFADEEGSIYQMTRLPMGHAGAPEIMQMITAALAGDPCVVKPEYASKSLTRVWIDNIKLSGQPKVVQDDLQRIDQFAKQVGIIWKPSDSYEGVGPVNWIGVSWNHGNGTVKVAEKTLRKINQQVDEWNSATLIRRESIEQLVGRFIWASGVVGIPIGRFYFTLKWARRAIRREGETVIPPAVMKEIMLWATLCGRSRRWEKPRDAYVLFTDASLEGWGATLIGPEQKLIITGARWPVVYRGTHINLLEAMALKFALKAFSAELSKTAVKVRVDNTTVMHSTIKGGSKSEELNRLIVDIRRLLDQHQITATIAYVKSGENPADIPSRTHNLQEAGLAVEAFWKRIGGGDDPKRENDQLGNVTGLEKRLR